MVSNKSSMRRRISSVTAGTGGVSCRRIGEPSTWMSSRLKRASRRRAGGWLCGLDADDARHFASLDHQSSVTGLDRDSILQRGGAIRAQRADVHHFADDTASRHDLVALFQSEERAFVFLALLLLRPDQDE